MVWDGSDYLQERSKAMAMSAVYSNFGGENRGGVEKFYVPDTSSTGAMGRRATPALPPPPSPRWECWATSRTS
jgi:hypothetical protein